MAPAPTSTGSRIQPSRTKSSTAKPAAKASSSISSKKLKNPKKSIQVKKAPKKSTIRLKKRKQNVPAKNYSELIQEAILYFDARNGSSRQAIKEYVKNKKGTSYSPHFLKTALKNGVATGILFQKKGSFKLKKDGIKKKEVTAQDISLEKGKKNGSIQSVKSNGKSSKPINKSTKAGGKKVEKKTTKIIKKDTKKNVSTKKKVTSGKKSNVSKSKKPTKSKKD